MTKAIEVSKIIIECLKDDGEPTVTNLALNKLLYFAQAHCLARLGRPLFEDRIEAWQRGPVIPDVYQTFKSFGSMPIVLTDSAVDNLSSDERELLSDVLSEYGQYSAKHLVALSHRAGSPWDLNYNETEEFHDREINQDTMKFYFSQNEILPKFELSQNIPVLNVLPADWYDPNEDAEWETYVK